jgi:glycosyltransferase involved in cell wall biosynthesis
MAKPKVLTWQQRGDLLRLFSSLRRSLISFFHRAVWNRLPRVYRRFALFRILAFMAPRPSARIVCTEKPIIVAGFLTTASGLGEAARICLDTLRTSNIEAHGIDLSEPLMQEGLRIRYEFAAGSRVSGPGTLILFVNPPLVPMALFHLGRRFIADKRIIGYWHWELPRLPHDWRNDAHYVHEVWVPSQFVASAVRASTRIPVSVLPHAIPLRPVSDMARYRPSGVKLFVLTVFNFRSGFTRKNPLAAVAAFQKAFGRDQEMYLLIKTMDGLSHPTEWLQLTTAIADAPNITLFDSVLPEPEISGLIDTADIVLSLHRSEGFGLIAAEAMMRGKPVVATNWSGSTDFLNSWNGCPVDYELVPAIDPTGSYHQPDQIWAEPQVEDAAKALRSLVDPGRRIALGARAAKHARELFGSSSYVATFSKLIKVDMSSIAKSG